MAAGDFQRVLSAMIAYPETCSALRNGDESLFEGQNLSPRELRRLREIARQRGMETCCTLYRANRLASLWTLLPHTCIILGDNLARETHLFWRTSLACEMRVYEEAERFARFLRERMHSNALENPFLLETLDFETACNAMRFAGPIPESPDSHESGRREKKPQAHTVAFRHDPTTMLQCFRDERTPPPDLPAGEFLLRLEEEAGEISVRDVTHPD